MWGLGIVLLDYKSLLLLMGQFCTCCKFLVASLGVATYINLMGRWYVFWYKLLFRLNDVLFGHFETFLDQSFRWGVGVVFGRNRLEFCLLLLPFYCPLKFFPDLWGNLLYLWLVLFVLLGQARELLVERGLHLMLFYKLLLQFFNFPCVLFLHLNVLFLQLCDFTC